MIFLRKVISCLILSGLGGFFSSSFSQNTNAYINTLFPAIPVFDKIYQQQFPAYELAKIQKANQKKFFGKYKNCKSDIRCICDVFLIKNTEKEKEISEEFLYQFQPILKYYQFNEDAGFTANQLKDSLSVKIYQSSMEIIERYALGKKGIYPQIDSMSFSIDNKIFAEKVDSAAKSILQNPQNFTYSIEPSVYFSIALLKINGRDEAIRFYPDIIKENEASIKKIKSVNFDSYPYSALLTPGYGPSDLSTPLSTTGRSRCDKVFEEFSKGQAQFIILSGGFVHPFKTPYCEAIEMKKYLVEEKKLSDSCIIVEPYARHTTTNVRNASRLAFIYGIPSEKKIRIVSSTDQEFYISSPLFELRCKQELGRLPYREIGRDAVDNLYFIPAKESLILNPNDPLDP
jgi:hypothetical protein